MYDPMVAKLIVWDLDRELATRRMIRALGEYEIGGLTTLIPFHSAILATEQWANGETCRDLLEDPDWLKSLAPEPARTPPPRTRSGGAAGGDRRSRLQGRGRWQALRRQGVRRRWAPPATVRAGAAAAEARAQGRWRRGRVERELASPLQGTVLRVAVEQGAEVEEGALICVIEAMKMENEIIAHRSERSPS